ncbi:response regulator [Candidatus Methylocalor cossyra]|uniref:histidine kinase n=1 Tax=Candidatus Methylocalor cossyra TaxID=3108543 RepID=A0ABM9NH98_9GAMM
MTIALKDGAAEATESSHGTEDGEAGDGRAARRRRLQRATQPPDLPDRPANPEPAPTIPDPELSWQALGPLVESRVPTRLLLADGDAIRAEYLARILAVRYEVRTADDDQALPIASQAPFPDVVLADLALLRRGRFKLLHALKSGAATRHIPVIAIAAGASEDALSEGLSAGVDDFLVKPFSRSELFARVNAARARRLAAEQQQDSEACQRVLLESMGEGVFIAQDRRVALCNRAFAELLGYTEAGCAGLPFEALVAPDQLERWWERYRRTVGDTPEPCGVYTVAFLRQDGERLPLEMRLRRIRYDGRFAMLGLVRAAAPRWRSEMARQWLTRIIESAQDFAALSEPDGKLLYLNPAGWRLLGRTTPAIPAGSIADYLAPWAREQVVTQGIPTALRTGTWSGPSALLGRDGVEIPVTQSVVAQRSETDEVDCLAIVARDLSAQLRAEQSWRACEAGFGAALRRAPIPVLARDGDGRLVEMSDSVTALTGWTREDLRDARAFYLKCRRLPEERVDAELEQWRRRLRSDQPGEPQEITLWTRSGEARLWWLHEAPPVPLPDGRDLVLSMAIDFTECRRAEEGLRFAERQKSQFVAMLAHELRNPLAPIRNAVRALREPGLGCPDSSWAVDVIARQVAQLSRLLDDLLDVSRITHGTLALRRQPLDLAAVVAQAVETSRPLIDFRRHKLEVALPEGPLAIEGDGPRLVQVFSNLLNNAAKYTDIGGRIDLIVEAHPGEAVVRVRDDGRGIDAELLPHVFDVFAQDERSLDRTQGGLGLGLPLARRLVELHGGRVEAHSPGTGLGAEFVVRLPRGTPALPDPQSEAVGGPQPRRSGLRILVVDDNVDSADSMALLLSLDGHDARTAFDGPGALAEAAEFRPQVVLLDIGLPGMDGYEVARRLRALPDLGAVLIIAVTGYGQDDDRIRSKAAGFDHHLVKPVDPDALNALLNGLVND